MIGGQSNVDEFRVIYRRDLALWQGDTYFIFMLNTSYLRILLAVARYNLQISVDLFVEPTRFMSFSEFSNMAIKNGDCHI